MSEEKPYKSVWGWDSVWETFILVWTQENTNLNISTNSSLVQLWKDTEALKQHSYAKQTELLTHSSVFQYPPATPVYLTYHAGWKAERLVATYLSWDNLSWQSQMQFYNCDASQASLGCFFFNHFLPIPFLKSFLGIENKDLRLQKHISSVCCELFSFFLSNEI